MATLSIRCENGGIRVSFRFATPREHLFKALGLDHSNPAGTNQLDGTTAEVTRFSAGRGSILWLKDNPVRLAANPEGERAVTLVAKEAAARARLKWRETNYLVLRRGPYLIAAGLEESIPGDSQICRAGSSTCSIQNLKFRDSVTLTPVRGSFCSTWQHQ